MAEQERMQLLQRTMWVVAVALLSALVLLVPALPLLRPIDADVTHEAIPSSAQPVISVPPEADNHSQTIVAAPKIQLQHDLPLPNIVSWPGKPQLPIAPAPAPNANPTRGFRNIIPISIPQNPPPTAPKAVKFAAW